MAYQVSRQILLTPQTAFTLGANITNDGVTADANGKKIIPAGTVLIANGDFMLDENVTLSVDDAQNDKPTVDKIGVTNNSITAQLS